MTRSSGAGKWRLPIAFIVAIAVCATSSSALAILLQEEPPPVEVGAGPIREPAWDLVGRAIYSSETVTLFGYFTALKGLNSSQLFTEDTRSEATARYTYAGEIALTDRADRGDVTSLRGEGVIRVFLDDEAGASWDDPASFMAGQPLAAFDVLLVETIHRQGPGTGLVIGDSDTSQIAAEQFTIGDQLYRFGDVGIGQRLRTVGAIIASADASSFTVGLTGGAAVNERPWTPVRLGTPATPTSGELSQLNQCPALDSWLDLTLSALAAADALAAPFRATEAIGEIDVEAARAAAEEVATLVSSQRAAAAPTGGDEADQLAITALSTYARGLQTIKDGAAAGDAELIGQGQLILADGVGLAARAREALVGLAAACPGS
jgi:hypothetical protein